MTDEENRICKELWNKYEPYLRNVCLAKMHGCEGDIDDVIAEVYLALCNHVSKNGSPTSPLAWLFATLRNIISQYFTSKYNREHYISDINIDQIELPYQYDFVEDVEKNSTIEELNKIIPQLNEREQTLIKLHSLERHKLKDIAKYLGISETAAKQTNYRTRRKIKKLLTKK